MSSLVNIQKSPKHFVYMQEHRKDSKSLSLGRAIHSLILEPENFNNDFMVMPKCDRRTKEGKEIYEILQKQSEGKEILSEDDYTEAKKISFSVLESPKIRNMLSKGQAEQSIFQNVEGIDMKFRLDFLSENFILDLKSCQSCLERDFQRDFINFNYHIKLAAYQHAVFLETGKLLPVIVLAVETKDECDYKVYQIDQDFLEIGKKEFFRLLEIYKECTDKDEWPSLEKKVDVLCAPEWLLKKDLLT